MENVFVSVFHRRGMLQKIKSRNQEKEGTLFTDGEASGGEDRMKKFAGIKPLQGTAKPMAKQKILSQVLRHEKKIGRK
ncbi:hypothetical protein [Angelakisella massiliensis]|uniref:hypothetical protein n=1 Tax=Angelakisella massiliensis TaxID=1871018 RepID=UPI0023A82741|nr:hypothetical protein [Angelakisella massiliensis]